MTDLFNKEDILTGVTADQAVIGTKGYFGDNLHDLINAVKHSSIKTLRDIDTDEIYCFESDYEYVFFLPIDKVKNKEPTYRPFNSLDELFNFFYPPKDDVYNQIEKAELLLGKKIVLREIKNGLINVMVIQNIKFNSDNSNVYLNNLSLDYIFNIYNIEKDSKWVTFGILEE